jgi:hypothetical protein
MVSRHCKEYARPTSGHFPFPKVQKAGQTPKIRRSVMLQHPPGRDIPQPQGARLRSRIKRPVLYCGMLEIRTLDDGWSVGFSCNPWVDLPFSKLAVCQPTCVVALHHHNAIVLNICEVLVHRSLLVYIAGAVASGGIRTWLN